MSPSPLFLRHCGWGVGEVLKDHPPDHERENEAGVAGEELQGDGEEPAGALQEKANHLQPEGGLVVN